MKRSNSNFPEEINLDRVSGFSLIYDYYSPLIWKHIFLRVTPKEEVNDLTSQVFLKTWEYLKSGGKIKQIKPFLYRTANNLVIDWYRSKKRVINFGESFAEEEMGLEALSEIERKIETEEKIKFLIEKLNLLREKEKTVLLMKFVDELEIGEIAQVLGKSKGAVSVSLHRALKSLDKLIDQGNDKI
jgi:RNA polymerase sigma-70 factor (ECF subfamily)